MFCPFMVMSAGNGAKTIDSLNKECFQVGDKLVVFEGIQIMSPRWTRLRSHDSWGPLKAGQWILKGCLRWQ